MQKMQKNANFSSIVEHFTIIIKVHFHTSMSCQFIGCSTRAYFNFPKTQPGVRCGSHRLHGMVNVYNRTCKYDECLKRPLFNFPGAKRGITCKEHAEEGMVDLQNPKCPVCKKYGIFNYIGLKGLFCSKHALEGMVFVNKNTCKHTGCQVSAKFNFPKEKKTGKFCSQHKIEGMINTSQGVCEIDNCITPSSYGERYGKPTHCYAHRSADMVDVFHKLCEFPKCSTRPAYNTLGNHTAKFCVVHKSEGMVHIEVYSCNSCGLEFRFRDTKAEKICPYCDPNSILRSKTKELFIKEVIEKAFPGLSFIHDRSIQSIETIDQRCVSRKFRPDFFFERNTHVVIVEVDEHQHSSYDASCERVRELHISEAIGRPTYFIRYNPDAYRVNGAAVRVPKNIREQRLIQVMKECLFSDESSECKTDTFLMRTVFLYYDENESL